MALFHLLRELPISLQVFHAHHGEGENQDFRDQSRAFVKKLCEDFQIPFWGVQADRPLRSENDFRKFRNEHLKSWCHLHPEGVVVMAHHQQDLLETRLMRLIRGTGPQGLRAMKVWNQPVWRPFLDWQSQDLRSFLEENSWKWVEDPSNQNPRYLRNWIRHQWLPALEKKVPGSTYRLAESLENLSSAGEKAFRGKMPTLELGQCLRQEYLALSPSRQLQTLALLLKSQNLKDFSLGQLKEIQKRLDNPQGRHNFTIAGAIWTVNAQQILVRPL